MKCFTDKRNHKKISTSLRSRSVGSARPASLREAVKNGGGQSWGETATSLDLVAWS